MKLSIKHLLLQTALVSGIILTVAFVGCKTAPKTASTQQSASAQEPASRSTQVASSSSSYQEAPPPPLPEGETPWYVQEPSAPAARISSSAVETPPRPSQEEETPWYVLGPAAQTAPATLTPVENESAALTQQNASRMSASGDQGTVLRPLTMDVINEVGNRGITIKNFAYYISASVILENRQNSRQIEINNQGEGVLRDMYTQNQVIVNRETEGMLVAMYRESPTNKLVLGISFDENNEGNTLLFRETTSARHFELRYDDEASRTIEYGGQIWQVRFNGGETPRLLIKFEEQTTVEPKSRQLLGRTASVW